jgi:hypothetical protein
VIFSCVHIIWRLTPLFDAGGLDKKRKHFIEGGQAGNREQYINNLVRVMN